MIQSGLCGTMLYNLGKKTSRLFVLKNKFVKRKSFQNIDIVQMEWLDSLTLAA